MTNSNNVKVKNNKFTKFSYKECIFIKQNALFFYSDKIILIKQSNLLDPKDTIGKFLIVISKKIGNAVIRNYIRRIIKEIIKKEKLYTHPFNYVIVVKNKCIFKEMANSLLNAFNINH